MLFRSKREDIDFSLQVIARVKEMKEKEGKKVSLDEDRDELAVVMRTCMLMLMSNIPHSIPWAKFCLPL